MEDILHESVSMKNRIVVSQQQQQENNTALDEKKNQRRVNAFLSSRSLKSRPRGVSSRRCVEFS